jgi:hypothetical protein
MKRRLLCILLVLCCFAFSVEGYAKTKLTANQRAEMKLAKRQRKAQKKFAKAQRKSQKKLQKQAKKLRKRRTG